MVDEDVVEDNVGLLEDDDEVTGEDDAELDEDEELTELDEVVELVELACELLLAAAVPLG